MKKLICLFLALLLLCGCGAPAEESTTAAPKATESAPAPTEPAGPAPYVTPDGQQVSVEPWKEAGLPTAGNYYLTADVVLEAPVEVSGDLLLHLNGHNVTAAEGVILDNLFVIPAGCSMTVYDRVLPQDYVPEYEPPTEYDDEEPEPLQIPGGSITSSRSFSGKVTVSSMFKVEGELTLAGGLIDARNINLEDRANGLAVYVCKGGKLNMVGGVVCGGTTWSFLKPEDILDENGEVIGTTEPDIIYGYGGCFYIDKGGQCFISGGVLFQGSAAHGGNIFVAGDETEKGHLVMTGGLLLAGEATTEGGNISSDGVVEMTGGELRWGRSYGHGGNMFTSGDLIMTGGTLYGGSCDVNDVQNKRGGNLAVNGLYATVKITNAQILNGEATCQETHGGNIACFGYGAVEFEVGEGTVITGGVGHRGGNIYIGHFLKDVPAENMDYVFTGVTLGGGTTSYRGANMCCDTKDTTRRILVIFNDCTTTVEDNTELNLAIGAGAKDVTQCDVIINGGSWSDGGFNIFGSGSLTVSGATLNDCAPSGTGTYIENP